VCFEKEKNKDIWRILIGDSQELKTKVEKVVINGELAWSR
jgi:hypothetical protein